MNEVHASILTMTYIEAVRDTAGVRAKKAVVGRSPDEGLLRACLLIVPVVLGSCLPDRATMAGYPPYAAPLKGTYVLGTQRDSVLRDTLLALRIVRLADGDRDTIVGEWMRVDRTAVNMPTGVLGDVDEFTLAFQVDF